MDSELFDVEVRDEVEIHSPSECGAGEPCRRPDESFLWLS
jgi:hypothetical protein